MTRSVFTEKYKFVRHFLAEAREKKGISRYELSGRCGLSETALGYIEKYERRPTLYTLKMIADALNVKVFELIKQIENNKI